MYHPCISYVNWRFMYEIMYECTNSFSLLRCAIFSFIFCELSSHANKFPRKFSRQRNQSRETIYRQLSWCIESRERHGIERAIFSSMIESDLWPILQKKLRNLTTRQTHLRFDLFTISLGTRILGCKTTDLSFVDGSDWSVGSQDKFRDIRGWSIGWVNRALHLDYIPQTNIVLRLWHKLRWNRDS